MTAALNAENKLDSMAASVGAGLHGDKAAQVLSRLASRDAQRKAQVEQQSADQRASAAPSESAHAFLLKLEAWQKHTQQIVDASAKMPSQDAATKEQLEQLSVSLIDMEQAAAQASYFLPAYDSRQTAITITSLREQIDAAKKQQAGKKKFGFSKKGKQPPTEKIMSSQQTLMKHSQPQDASLSQPQQTVAPAHLRGMTDRQNEDIVQNAEDLAGGEYNMTNLQSCNVQLQGPLSSLHLRNLVDCAVEAGPVSGPIFVHGARNCILKLASHQIRIHDAHSCKVYLRLRSNPIIEHSDGLQFAPYSPSYPGSTEYINSAGLNQDNGLWQQVQDFGWLRKSQSPNWCIMPDTGTHECATHEAGS